MSNKQEIPHKVFGAKLKSIREKQQKSLVEVSGALELDVDYLEKIEQGYQLPDDDQLLHIINYFELSQIDSELLLKLAGADDPRVQADNQEDQVKQAFKETMTQIMVMPMDSRIVYTDMARVTTNDYGLTLTFMQTNGQAGQPLAVSRVGMSREHAESLIKILQQSLKKPDPKQLNQGS